MNVCFSVFVRLFNTFIILSVHLFSFSLINHIFKVIPSNLSSGHKIHTLSTMLTFLTVFSIKCQAICQKFCGFERGLNMFEIGITKNSKILFLQAKCQKSLQTKGPGQSWPELIFGGGGGIWTHVQEHFRKTFSERSWYFIIRSCIVMSADYTIAIPQFPCATGSSRKVFLHNRRQLRYLQVNTGWRALLN